MVKRPELTPAPVARLPIAVSEKISLIPSLDYNARMDEAIVRSLADGPDYTPDWRSRVVQKYLAAVATAGDSEKELGTLLDTEKDPFVRTFARFRYNGAAVNSTAFRYAVGCQARNGDTGAASMIRAMLVADRTPAEIAVELGTQTQNIVTFAKIYFDVRRYLDNEGWLRRIVFAEPLEGMNEAAALRERRWLAAAFHRGWEGVQQVVFHRTSNEVGDVKALTRKLQSTLASRALEYVMDLETSGAPASEADLSRFLAARNSHGEQPSDSADQPNSLTAFIHGIHGIIQKKAEEFPDDPRLDVVRESKAASLAMKDQPPQRRRRRFGDA